MFSVGLAEIVLIVNDVKASARFYRDVVGLTPEPNRMTPGPGFGLVLWVKPNG